LEEKCEELVWPQTILNGKKNTTEIKMKIVQEMGFLRRLTLVFSD
jgi:hypothetical protein